MKRSLQEIIDQGIWRVPAKTHLDIESSLVTPHEYDRCVLPRGITTAICDPHDFANVLGLDGIRFLLDGGPETIMGFRVQLPSCVPATQLEMAGAARRRQPDRLGRSSQSGRPCRLHEPSRSAGKGRVVPRQAGGRSWSAYRRPPTIVARSRSSASQRESLLRSGWIDIELPQLARQQVDGLNDDVLQRTRPGGRPDDFVGIIAVFASAASDFFSGTALPVDGGYSIAI